MHTPGFIRLEKLHCKVAHTPGFIRLEKLHCKVAWKVSGELTWPRLTGVGQWIMIAITMRWFFPIGIFHGKSLYQSYDVTCLLLIKCIILLWLSLPLLTKYHHIFVLICYHINPLSHSFVVILTPIDKMPSYICSYMLSHQSS